MRPPPWSPRPPPPPPRGSPLARLSLHLLPLDSLVPSTLLPPPRQAEAPQLLPRAPHGEAGSTASGADAGGGPTCRVAMLSYAEPRGHARKEEKLKSRHSCENCKCGAQLCKPSASKTSEQTTAPAAQMGLASAAANFVGANSGGGGKSESEMPPGTHSTSRS